MIRPLALLAAAVLALPLAAQEDKARGLESAPVRVANRTIIVLRGPIAGYHAQERAGGAMDRIDAVLDAEPRAAVSTEDTPDGTLVLVGGKRGFLVTGIDIDKGIGETTQNVAREAARRLEAAVAARIEQRSPRYLVEAALLSLGATLVVAALLWLLLLLRRRADARIASAASAQTQKLSELGLSVGTHKVLAVTRPLLGFLTWAAVFALLWAWLAFVLKRFPYTVPAGERIGRDLLVLLGGAGGAVLDALPGLLLVVVIYIIARVVNRVAKLFFDRVERGHLQFAWLDEDTAGPTRRILAIAVWVFALAMAYPYLPGAQSDAFKGLSVLIGLMVSLGAASVLGQAFSGLSLMYTSAFRPGDYVRIGSVEGTVTELGMFITRIRTGLGTEITLPNASVMSSGVTNYSRAVKGTGFVIDTAVTIGYSTPWRQVEAMLLEATRRVPDVAQKPPPGVRQTALSDYYVEYLLIAYTPLETPRSRAEVMSDLHAAIQDVFNEYGVQIMSPHYVLDPKEPQVVPKDKWFQAPAKPPKAPG